MIFARANFVNVSRASHHDGSYHFLVAVWRAKARNRIVKATAKEIECPLLNRQLVANHPRLCWVSINVPLEPPDQQYWEAAVGYVELGMFQDANDQLENIDPFNRAAPEVLAVRLVIYRGLKKWELMQQIAKRLRQFEPDNVQWTTSLAYATRRAYSIDMAMEILLNAEAKFPTEGAIPYNLACYYCQLGEMETAKRYLKKAFEIDLNWRKAALDDEDLKPFWDSLQTT
jgi:tetratricopeptide (TPR) repeat protein